MLLNNIIGGIIILIIFLGLFITSKNKLSAVGDYSFLSFYNTDIIKGIAAFFIVFEHLGYFAQIRYTAPLGGIGVAMFLITSGYGLEKSYQKKGLQNFFKKRLSKVLIPYLIIILISTVVNISEFNGIKFFKEIFLIDVYGFHWYIQQIIILYIIYYLIHKFIPKNYQLTALLVYSVVQLLLINNSLFGAQVFSFTAGVAITKRNNNEVSNKKYLLTSCILLVIALSLLALKQFSFMREANYIMFNLNQSLFNLLSALGVCIIAFLFLRLKTIKIFKIPGKISYELYLVHTILIFMIKDLTIPNIIIYLSISFAGTFLLNWVGSLIIKRIK